MRRAPPGRTISAATKEEMTMHRPRPAGLREPRQSGATRPEPASSRASRRERERLVEAVRMALARARARRARNG
jgi:hypothetical protein